MATSGCQKSMKKLITLLTSYSPKARALSTLSPCLVNCPAAELRQSKHIIYWTDRSCRSWRSSCSITWWEGRPLPWRICELLCGQGFMKLFKHHYFDLLSKFLLKVWLLSGLIIASRGSIKQAYHIESKTWGQISVRQIKSLFISFFAGNGKGRHCPIWDSRTARAPGRQWVFP